VEEMLKNNSVSQNFILNTNECINGKISLNGLINTTQILLKNKMRACKKFTLEELLPQLFMKIDFNTINSLNLFENIYEKNFSSSEISKNNQHEKKSVFSILNQCVTKFGSRLLKAWMLHPLQNIEEINDRLNIVEALYKPYYFCKDIRTYLSKLCDIQSFNLKLANFISSQKDPTSIQLGEIARLRSFIAISKELYFYLEYYDGVHKDLFTAAIVNSLKNILEKLQKLEDLIAQTIKYNENTKDYYVKDSLSAKLGEINKGIQKTWKLIEDQKEELKNFANISKVTLEERENSMYVMLVPKNNQGESLVTKQNHNYQIITTNKANIVLTNSTLNRLSKEYRELKSDLRSQEVEFKNKIIGVVSTYHPLIEQLISNLSTLDVLCSFATLANNGKDVYCKPILFHEKTKKLNLKDCRHIILENNDKTISASIKNTQRNQMGDNYNRVVSNDCIMDSNSNIHIITGINMGGKSTYLKQVGICVFLAHIGCFVPSSYMELPIIDQIISRVGADDNSSRKMSTFMCEMMEVSNMLNIVTENSLVLIDELGRGTSTDDGIGLSYSILEHLARNINCFCLCATHFSELNEMEKTIKNIENKHVDCEISSGIIKMTYKIVKGCTNKSYGVNLLKSMSFPTEIVNLAEIFLNEEVDKLESIIIK